MSRTISTIKEWYRGPYVKSDPNSQVFRVGYDPHWTAQWVRAILTWSKRNYKWALTTCVAVVVAMTA